MSNNNNNYNKRPMTPPKDPLEEEFDFGETHGTGKPHGTPIKKDDEEENKGLRKRRPKMPLALPSFEEWTKMGAPEVPFTTIAPKRGTQIKDTTNPKDKAGGGKKKRTKKKGRKGKKFPKKYLPKKLTRKDRKKQRAALLKSKKNYKKGKYVTRKKVKSFKSKTSNNILNARKMYGVEKVGATRELARKTGCSVKGLNRIIKKGQGAYYSSGSRPNQTAHSWGVARLASSITAGKAAAVDFHILEEHCDKSKKAYKMGLKAKRIHGKGTRKVPKTN